jgi:hypothetical protein
VWRDFMCEGCALKDLHASSKAISLTPSPVLHFVFGPPASSLGLEWRWRFESGHGLVEIADQRCSGVDP